MSYHKPSQLRRAENEVIFKEHNERILEELSDILPDSLKDTFPINFTCECSNETCAETIVMTAEEFRHFGNDPKVFIIKTHHSQDDIEAVIEHHGAFEIVRKFEIPPTTNGVLNRT